MKILTEAEYEDLINNSPVFSLDKETERSTYEKEKSKLTENIVNYLQHYWKKKQYDDELKIASRTYEVFQTISSCLKSYTPEKGGFLSYFNTAWENTWKSIISTVIKEKSRAGMHIGRKYDKAYLDLKKYLQSKGRIVECTSEKELKDILLTLGYTEKDIPNVFQLIYSKTISFDAPQGEDEDCTLEEIVANNENVEKDLLEVEAIISIAKKVEVMYIDSQERQHRIMEMYYTSLFYENLGDDKLIKDMAFFDATIWKECNEKCRPLNDKEIAERLGISKSDMSNRIKKFEDKLKGK